MLSLYIVGEDVKHIWADLGATDDNLQVKSQNLSKI